MLVNLWLSLGAFATLMTLTYAFILPDERVYFSAGLAAVAWGVMSMSAQNLTRLTDQGKTEGVETPSLQFFTFVLALLSLLVLILYRFGEYPPETEPGDESR